MIEIKDMTYRIGARTLFDDVNLTLLYGQKVGLIGPNGTGKTTLFNLILGNLEPQAGSINYARKNLSVTTVKQEIDNKNEKLIDFVLKTDTKRIDLLNALETETDGMRLAEIHDELITIKADAAPAKAASILAGLGFTNEDLERPLKEFSGGWQMRAALAATLFMPADILLLDEPTNHLDIGTTIWLENYLTKLPSAIFLISHDKDILNRLCQKIVEIDHLKLKGFTGNYDGYVEAKAMQAMVQERALEKFEAKRKHMQAFVDRFRYKATKAKQAQSRIKMIEKMGEAPELPKDIYVTFRFPSPEGSLPPPILSLEKASTGYGDKTVLSNLNLRIDAEDRIALLGANGNGKTTLANLISGKLPLFAGELKKSGKLRVAHFTQHQTETLNPSLTAYEIMEEHMRGKKPAEIRTHLGGFGLSGDKALTKVENLSGGEKSRLLLALITKDKPHILILDEPTNHLDIQSREALVEALNDYTGAVILITHDLYMIELTSDDLWLVENGTCKPYKGDLEDYKKQVLSEPKKEEKKAIKKEDPKPEPKKKENTFLLNEIEKLEKKKKELEDALSENYTDEKQIEYTQLLEKLRQLEEKWLQ